MFLVGKRKHTSYYVKIVCKIILGPRTTTERSGKRHGVKWIRVE
jgi:hypothetical protein